jgi:hypothetical protein
VATGGYGGVLRSTTAGLFITSLPTRKHAWQSEVRMTELPMVVDGLLRRNVPSGESPSASRPRRESSCRPPSHE